MKRFSYIFILSLIYLICSSKGCTDDGNVNEIREEKLFTASRDSLIHAFEFDTPGYKLLRGYEATATQKLTDFADYLKIASDLSIDKTFRQQASEMAGRLYISLEVNTRNWSKPYQDPDFNTLKELLEKSLSNGMPCWTLPTHINVETPLTLKNDSTCSGTLSFYQQSIPFDNSKQIESAPVISVINIYAIKKVKTFGKESLTIWEVYLGDIK